MDQFITNPPSGSPGEILLYLQFCLPGYPFDPNIDNDFVDELVDDFPESEVLEEIKAFRWFYLNQPAAHVRNLRLAIRRWIVNAFLYSSR